MNPYENIDWMLNDYQHDGKPLVSHSFLSQTAADYDMELYEVERIHRLYPDRFYEELEVFIKQRSQNCG